MRFFFSEFAVERKLTQHGRADSPYVNKQNVPAALGGGGGRPVEFWKTLLPFGQPGPQLPTNLPSFLSKCLFHFQVWKLEKVVFSVHRHTSSLRNAHGSLVSLHADPSFGELSAPGWRMVPLTCGRGISGTAFLVDVDLGVYLYD